MEGVNYIACLPLRASASCRGHVASAVSPASQIYRVYGVGKLAANGYGRGGVRLASSGGAIRDDGPIRTSPIAEAAMAHHESRRCEKAR